MSRIDHDDLKNVRIIYIFLLRKARSLLGPKMKLEYVNIDFRHNIFYLYYNFIIIMLFINKNLIDRKLIN